MHKKTLMASITVSDFKCYQQEKTFYFPKSSLCHITGPSGAGKSTILAAFEWCLFGHSNSNIRPKGKKSSNPFVSIKFSKGNCCEDLKTPLSGLIIERTANSLKVYIKFPRETILTEDAAQGYIITAFGERNLWIASSFLLNGNKNLLLVGTGDEKLRILRNFAYGSGIGERDDPDYYLSVISAELKNINSETKVSQVIYDLSYETLEKDIEIFNRTENLWAINETYESIDDVTSEIKTITKDIKEGFSKNEKRKDLLLERDALVKKKQEIVAKIDDTDFLKESNILNKQIFDLEEKIKKVQYYELLSQERKLLMELRDLGSEINSWEKENFPFSTISQLTKKISDVRVVSEKARADEEKRITLENEMGKIIDSFENEGTLLECVQDEIDINHKSMINLEGKKRDLDIKINLRDAYSPYKIDSERLEKVIKSKEERQEWEKKLFVLGYKGDFDKIEDYRKLQCFFQERKNKKYRKDLVEYYDGIRKSLDGLKEEKRSTKEWLTNHTIENEFSAELLQTTLFSIKALDENIKKAKEKTHYLCPKCDAFLYVQKGKLVSTERVSVSALNKEKEELTLFSEKLKTFLNLEENERELEKLLGDEVKELSVLKINFWIEEDEYDIFAKKCNSPIRELSEKELVELFELAKFIPPNIDEEELEILQRGETVKKYFDKHPGFSFPTSSEIDELEEAIVETKEKGRVLEKKQSKYLDQKNRLNILTQRREICQKTIDELKECASGTDKIYSLDEELSKLLLLQQEYYIYVESKSKKEEIQRIRNILCKNKTEESSIPVETHNMDESQQELEEKIKVLKNNVKDLNEKNLEQLGNKNKLSSVEERISRIESLLQTEDVNINYLEKELSFHENLHKDYFAYSILKNKIKDLEEKEKILDEKKSLYQTYEKLYEIIRKVSMEPIEELIDAINEKTNQLLDLMFEEPIKLFFSLYRPSVDNQSLGKISVNLQIYLGGNTHTTINTLSSGEADRISIAVSSVLNSLSDSPILFFDECMSTLESDVREKCLILIRETLVKNGKSVIDICHESVEGYHDLTIPVLKL